MTTDSQTNKELVAIKKLLILGLIHSGLKLDEIGSALDLDPTNVSRMFRKGTFAKGEASVAENDEKILIQEVQAVKKLLMLQLLATGYQQKHLAATLGVSAATLSRMLPKGLPNMHSRDEALK